MRGLGGGLEMWTWKLTGLGVGGWMLELELEEGRRLGAQRQDRLRCGLRGGFGSQGDLARGAHCGRSSIRLLRGFGGEVGDSVSLTSTGSGSSGGRG
jgi:hypothetical protein